jgi:nucleoside-diphosphate-sugar epimerase
MLPTDKNLPVDRSQADKFLSQPSEAVHSALDQIEGTILVLGAGGKMGLHICSMIQTADRAAGRENRVTAVSRFSSVNGREPFETQGIPCISCDLEDDTAVAALPDAPNIIFMAGAKFGTSDQPDLLERMNVELPRRIAQRFVGSRSLVFSSGCVYSMLPTSCAGSRETDPTDPPGDYAISVLAREKAFAEAATKHGTKVALIRLNYATEFRYGVLVDVAQRVFDGEPVNLDMGYVNVIWQRDAVDQILQAFPLADTGPDILNITGADKLSVRELALRFGKLFNRDPILEGCEAETAWLNDASKSHALFGAPPTSVDQMLEWTAAWIAAGGESLGKPTGFQNRDGEF